MLQNKRSLNGQTIYQVFVRQFSPTHDFNGVTAQLDRIKALGTDILYLLPFYPIGKKGRKGSVGSPYSIYDYTQIDPLNGTTDDFKRLLEQAHKRDMRVIIDMVLNHTSRDSVLLQRHPDWFYKIDGEVGNRVGDWSDVCDLDYDNAQLCDYITQMLVNWVQMGVDGFRMDVCSLVPAHLWKQAVDALHLIKPDLIMLGESVELGFVRYIRNCGYQALSDGELYNYFDILYSYDTGKTQHAFLEKQGGTLSDWLNDVANQDARYPSDYVKARYLDNHDRERVAKYWQGDALKTLWALNFYLKGAAFVYAGDETSFDVRNSLFEIDPVVWNFGGKADISEHLATLSAIKKHPVYSYGCFDISVCGDNVAVGSYRSADCLSVGVFNLSDGGAVVSVPLPDGNYVNLADGSMLCVADGKLAVGAYGWIIVETAARN